MNENPFGLLTPPSGSVAGEGSSPAAVLSLPAANQMQVSPAATMTAPLPVTEVENYRYYMSAILDAGIHRNDGKRLSFIHGYFRTNIMEDIYFLDNEIRTSHPIIRTATEAEIETMKGFFDPKKAQTERVLKENFGSSSLEEIKAELRAKMLEEITTEVEQRMKQANVLGVSGTDKVGDVSGSVAAQAQATGQPLMQTQRPMISPQSTAQINGGAADSNGKATLRA